ncbi:Sterol 3-beta-glucosyltransferase [Drechslerella dactyloides]|uniref:Sterol 3-beta-glucosyltransferase n=1 Tax=Drechslerella dactyloides TaxID=74499 RepID=A0AAD6J0C2_DREDA|nr:Sterol 3-beta-glucosyltransferase [Drechslerella dactyloides]
MSDRRGSPEHPQEPRQEPHRHAGGDAPNAPPPLYNYGGPSGEPSAAPPTAQSHQQDVKTGSDGWPSEPLSQIPTATSDFHQYNPNTGISTPPSLWSSITHRSSHYHIPVVSDPGHDESVPPPAYSEVGNSYHGIEIDQNGFSSKARMLDDGRIDISINQRSRRFSNMLLPALSQTLSQIPQQPVGPAAPAPEFDVPKGLAGKDVPKLNIVIQIIGSRGDVQPFVALGKVLKNNPPYHRVRIATHATFQKFVEENDLEFFSIGGDPAELMAFMVKNPGLMPGWDSLKQGDVPKRRKAMYEMLIGSWRSCIEGGNGLTPQNTLVPNGGVGPEGVFIADAIIANPPSFAHIHCAERLAIPLHLMFTMPWSPTQSFPHPLANIRSSNTEANITNFLTYTMVDMMTWQGLGDLVNKFREKTLGLDPISTMWAPGMILRLKVPHTYCWSPALIPKPQDWGDHIKISGFYFLDLANNYTPPDDLAAFLDAGPPPVYIGFGSIVVDDPNHLTNMIFEAIKITGVRALVSKGWGGLGGDSLEIPENVFMLGNCPHDWLFKKVACVVHHGGAGTTAIGVALGKPTVIVPFFGDQPFWGSMVNRAGAGPPPVPFKELTAEKLAESITFALSPEAQMAAGAIADKIKQEQGTVTGTDSFHASLDKQRLRCLVDPRRTAVWRVKRTEVRLSAAAAAYLHQSGLLYYSDLKLCRHQEWQTASGPIEPISGAAGALLGTIGSVMVGMGSFPKEIFKAAKQTHPSEGGMGSDLSPIAPSGTPPVATSQSTPSLLSDRTPSFKSEKDSEATSLSSYDPERGQSKESLGQMPTPTPTSGASDPPREPTPSIYSTTSAQSNPEPDTKSHRSVMASAMSHLHHSRSTSPMRMWGKGKNSKSPTDTPTSRRSPSPPRRKLHKDPPEPHRSNTDTSIASASSGQSDAPHGGVWLGAGRGAGKIAGAVIKSPLDFSLAIAQGFRNAPLLYGDTTVRKQDKITSAGSGLKVAGKEFAYGLYDGFAGLVTQPIQGAKEEGQLGFWKGVGKGIGGLALKPSAALMGLPGYTFKGIYEEIRKHNNSDMSGYIVAARITQGIEELKTYQQAELDMMLKRWNALNVERVKGRAKHRGVEGKGKDKDDVEDNGNGKGKKKRFTCHIKDEVSVAPPEDEAAAAEEEIADAPGNRYQPVIQQDIDQETMNILSNTAPYRRPIPPPLPTRRTLTSSTAPKDQQSPVAAAPLSPVQRQMQAHQTLAGLDNHEQVEAAIQESVRMTSRGDPHEDQMIEQAIRASMAEVVNQDSGEDDDLVLKRAITASLETANSHEKHDEAHAEALQQAITKSLAEPQAARKLGPDTDANELARAIEESKYVQQPPQAGETQDLERVMHISRREEEERRRKQEERGHDQKQAEHELQRALEMSKQEEEAKRREKEEEEVVMKYVMKMSLAEQKYRSAANFGDAGPSSSTGPTTSEDDQLARAIQESLRYA